MTQDELDALPVANDMQYIREMDAKGYTTLTPTVAHWRLLSTKPDDYVAIGDRHGNVWQTGWADGVQYKAPASRAFR